MQEYLEKPRVEFNHFFPITQDKLLLEIQWKSKNNLMEINCEVPRTIIKMEVLQEFVKISLYRILA